MSPFSPHSSLFSSHSFSHLPLLLHCFCSPGLHLTRLDFAIGHTLLQIALNIADFTGNNCIPHSFIQGEVVCCCQEALVF